MISFVLTDFLKRSLIQHDHRVTAIIMNHHLMQEGDDLRRRNCLVVKAEYQMASLADG